MNYRHYCGWLFTQLKAQADNILLINAHQPLLNFTVIWPLVLTKISPTLVIVANQCSADRFVYRHLSNFIALKDHQELNGFWIFYFHTRMSKKFTPQNQRIDFYKRNMTATKRRTKINELSSAFTL